MRKVKILRTVWSKVLSVAHRGLVKQQITGNCVCTGVGVVTLALGTRANIITP